MDQMKKQNKCIKKNNGINIDDSITTSGSKIRSLSIHITAIAKKGLQEFTMFSDGVLDQCYEKRST